MNGFIKSQYTGIQEMHSLSITIEIKAIEYDIPGLQALNNLVAQTTNQCIMHGDY